MGLYFWPILGSWCWWFSVPPIKLNSFHSHSRQEFPVIRTMSLQALAPIKKEGIEQYLTESGLDESKFQVFVDCSFYCHAYEKGIDIVKSLKEFLGGDVVLYNTKCMLKTLQTLVSKKEVKKAKKMLELKTCESRPDHDNLVDCFYIVNQRELVMENAGTGLYFMATQDWDLSETEASHMEEGCLSMPTISWDGSELVLRPKLVGKLEKTEEGKKGSTSTST